MPGDGLDLIAWFDALGDLARLRLLRLLEREELSVGELARSLQLPQSTVSRHLKLLFEGKWVRKRSEGTASLYRMSPDDLASSASRLWTLAREQLGESATLAEDDHRLREVLAERRTDSRAFFGRIGGEWQDLRRDLFGDGFTAEALLGLVSPRWTIADLGCGTGSAAELLAPVAGKIIAVDRETAMLEAARRRLGGHDNVEFRQGELAALPLDDAEVDAAIVFLVMVYVEDPAAVVAEIARVVRPGGALLIVDLIAHDRESYVHTMGHHHLGFTAADIEGWAATVGLGDVRWRRLRPDTGAKGPGLFCATMWRR